jgi:hypothetical protein
MTRNNWDLAKIVNVDSEVKAQGFRDIFQLAKEPATYFGIYPTLDKYLSTLSQDNRTDGGCQNNKIMTAKDIIDKYGIPLYGQGSSKKSAEAQLILMLNEFARAKCEEQNDILWGRIDEVGYNNIEGTNFYQHIKNAVDV